MEKIRHQLIIGTTAVQVYHAITTPHGLSNWWAPHITTDTEPGGIARIQTIIPNYPGRLSKTNLNM